MLISCKSDTIEDTKGTVKVLFREKPRRIPLTQSRVWKGPKKKAWLGWWMAKVKTVLVMARRTAVGRRVQKGR